MEMKKKYKLRKEIKKELAELGIEILGIFAAIGFVYLLFLLNAIIF